LNRSFVSALLSLACLSTLPALGQAGSTQADVTLSVGANPTATGVSLTGTVQPPMPSSPTALPHPDGTLTFFDGSTALNTGGTALTAGAAYTSATFAQTFGTSDAIQANPIASWQSVTGDFNEDGTPDLLLLGSGDNLLLWQVFASIPGGKFVVLPFQNFPFRDIPFPGLSVLDVDGDGHLDLLIGNLVVRGKGDGTFFNTDATILPALAGGFIQAYAVDVNGDGKLDVVAVNMPPEPTTNPSSVQFTFTVFRNDGGETFTSLGTFPLAPSFQTGNLCCASFGIIGLNFADVNGDGKLDVLSQSTVVNQTNFAGPIHFDVVLNNGDGTFGTIKSVDTSALLNITPDGVAFGDVNGDGKQDLVLAFSNIDGTNFLGAALGNGDGTFGAFSQLKLINFITVDIPNPQVQLIDFNADGKLDAVLGSGELALGKGDGTFALSTPLFAQPANPQTPISYPLLQANFFAHSLPSLVYLNFTSGADAVFTPQVSSSASTSVALSAGTHTLTAHYSGDSTYAAGVSPAVDITVALAATSTALTTSSNPSYAGQSVTFTATIAGLAPGASGTVTFSNGSTTLGTAALSNGSASYSTTFSSAGNQTITAAYGGDANDAPSSGNISQSVVASPISFPTPPPGSTTLTVASGSDASGSITIDAVAGYSGALVLTCSGLPANASCSFTPQVLGIAAPSGGYGIIVATSSSEPVLGKEDDSVTRPRAVEWCGVSLLGLLLMGRILRSRVGRLSLVLAAGVFVSLTGCGGSGKSTTTGSVTPPGTYTFQLNAATSPMRAGPYSSPVSQTYTLIVQ
jgi:hypothetical protein